jgi:hypothetical protein
MVALALLALVLGLDITQAPGLRIRVLAGEGAVNVTQQKTAVSPVIAVADRNGLPVPGATVTFSIVGANLASFPDGATSFTATTDAGGQATAAAITPLSAGTFAIRAQARFQGLSGAVTIAQTNVANEAKAAEVSQPVVSVPIGGKGISKVALAAIGATVAASGALAASQIGGDTVPVVTVPTAVEARAFRVTGTFNGTLVHNVTFASGGAPCTIEHSVQVDLTTELTLVANNLQGSIFRINEADTPVSWTCESPRTVTNTFIGSGTMTGAAGALNFQMARTFTTQPTAGFTEVVDMLHEFAGGFNGTEVSGTYSFQRRVTLTGPGGYRQEATSRMTLPVTMR